VALARKLFDAAAFSQAALRSSWPDLSRQERTQLTELIETLLTARFAPRADPEAPFTVVVISTRLRRGKVLVRTQVNVGTKSRAVDFVLAPRAKGFGVIDVAIDGISLLRNYRAAFSKTLRTRGFGGLLERLARSIAEATGRPAP